MTRPFSPRLPLDPVLRWTRAQDYGIVAAPRRDVDVDGNPHEWSLKALAELLEHRNRARTCPVRRSFSRHLLMRAARDGLTLEFAEDLAVLLEEHPSCFWPEWWQHALVGNEGEEVEVAC